MLVGYCYEIVEDENGAASKLDYVMKKKSVIIPFSTKYFEELTINASEATILATSVVVKNKNFA